MQCLKPLSLRNPKWLDGDTTVPRWLSVPCGKCSACKMRRRKDWTFRLQQESRHSSSQLFITLTYDNMFLPLDSDGIAHVSKRDCQLFLKLLRKRVSQVSFNKLRYYLCSEYGPTTLRPHYHMILFNFPIDILEPTLTIQKCWDKGFIQCGPLLDGGASYVSKYVLADFDYNYYPRTKPFSLMSKGLGKDFVNEKIINYCYAQSTYSIPTSSNSRVVLPRYLRQKIFDEETLHAISEDVCNHVAKNISLSIEREFRRPIGSVGISSQQKDAYDRKVKQRLKSKHKDSKL